MTSVPISLALSAGEPAGIGPDLCLDAACRTWPARLVAFADRQMLAERARRLGIAVDHVGERPAEPGEPAVECGVAYAAMQLGDQIAECGVVALGREWLVECVARVGPEHSAIGGGRVARRLRCHGERDVARGACCVVGKRSL